MEVCYNFVIFRKGW